MSVSTVLGFPSRAASRLTASLNRLRGRWFDRELGVETEGRDRDRSRPEAEFEVYVPTPAHYFARIVRRSRVDPARFAFVDLGAGKGRTLLVASRLGFRSVLGVEYDEAIFRQAAGNIARARTEGGAPAVVVHGDARHAALPEGDLFVFMFNPFVGKTFEEVAQRLAAASRQGRAVVIAYSNDLCGDVLERAGPFRRVRPRPRRFWHRPTMSIFYNDTAWNMRR